MNGPWPLHAHSDYRSLPHLSTLVRLADRAGALEDPELAAERWNGLLATHGIATAAVPV